MSAPKLKPKDLTICVKCGNIMITKKIRINNSNRVEFQSIMQCIVCRFWISKD